jgi:lipopolysaccharide core galacturonosyltransferase RgtB
MIVGGDGDRVRADDFDFSARTFFILLAIYFGLHVLTRSIVSSNLQLDEAEQFVLNQTWRLGYGSQPPLYDWIQHALFETLGANVFALSLLKNIALFGAYVFTFLAAREILSNTRLAILATAGLLFFPQIAWESQRDQSHLVLATTCAAATLFVYIRLLKTNSIKWYALFGVAVAVGFLSKYNYMLLPVSLLVATVLHGTFRRALLTPKIFVTLLAFLAVMAPHVIWMLGNKAAVVSQSYKFALTGELAPMSAFAGVFHLTKAFVGLAGVPLLIFSPFLIKTRGGKPAEANPFLPLLLKTFIAGFALLLLLILVEHVTYLRDRWIQPLLFALPILLVGFVQEKLTEGAIRRLLGLSAFVAITVLTAINFTVIGANTLHRSHNLNIPYGGLAGELRAHGFQSGAIIANGFFLGGNLKKQFRNSRVIVPELNETIPAERPTLIIWSARHEDVPEDFMPYAARISGVATNELQPRYLDIPCRNGWRQSEKFGYVLLR